MNKREYEDIIAFHPGYYLQDIIDNMGITQDEFAKRLGTSGKNLSDLLNGKTRLSDAIALNLSKMLGTSVDVWLNLQKTYTEKVLEIERRIAIDEEAELIKEIDFQFFVKLNVIPAVRSAAEKVDALLKYFKISSLRVLCQPDFLVNYKTAISDVCEKNVLNSNAWVQTAINIGQSYKTNNFDLKKLKEFMPEIRQMTLKEPQVFYPRLKEIFTSCGIAFVVLPHLKNSGVNGAVKWINKEKVILAINDRRKFADTFWFCLAHEIGHIFQQKVAMLIVSRNLEDMDETNKNLENQADEFAQNYLIPHDKYLEFTKKHDFSGAAVRRFSESIGIHPGIVVGRLQREKLVRYQNLNKLKEKFEIAYKN